MAAALLDAFETLVRLSDDAATRRQCGERLTDADWLKLFVSLEAVREAAATAPIALAVRCLAEADAHEAIFHEVRNEH